MTWAHGSDSIAGMREIPTATKGNTMKALGVTLLTAGVSTGTLLLGMGMGYLSADGVPDLQTQTKTVEVEVPVEVPVEKIVEKEVPVEVEVVKWKTKEVAPDACRDAISAAEEVGIAASDFADIMAQYPPLVAKSYSAGLMQNMQKAESVLTTMEGLNEDMDSVLAHTEDAVRDFNSAKAGC